jgi:hypothetical protein
LKIPILLLLTLCIPFYSLSAQLRVITEPLPPMQIVKNGKVIGGLGNHGTKRLKAVILTHPDSDHTNLLDDFLGETVVNDNLTLRQIEIDDLYISCGAADDLLKEYEGAVVSVAYGEHQHHMPVWENVIERWYARVIAAAQETNFEVWQPAVTSAHARAPERFKDDIESITDEELRLKFIDDDIDGIEQLKNGVLNPGTNWFIYEQSPDHGLLGMCRRNFDYRSYIGLNMDKQLYQTSQCSQTFCLNSEGSVAIEFPDTDI